MASLRNMRFDDDGSGGEDEKAKQRKEKAKERERRKQEREAKRKSKAGGASGESEKSTAQPTPSSNASSTPSSVGSSRGKKASTSYKDDNEGYEMERLNQPANEKTPFVESSATSSATAGAEDAADFSRGRRRSYDEEIAADGSGYYQYDARNSRRGSVRVSGPPSGRDRDRDRDPEWDGDRRYEADDRDRDWNRRDDDYDRDRDRDGGRRDSYDKDRDWDRRDDDYDRDRDRDRDYERGPRRDYGSTTRDWDDYDDRRGEGVVSYENPGGIFGPFYAVRACFCGFCNALSDAAVGRREGDEDWETRERSRRELLHLGGFCGWGIMIFLFVLAVAAFFFFLIFNCTEVFWMPHSLRFCIRFW